MRPLRMFSSSICVLLFTSCLLVSGCSTFQDVSPDERMPLYVLSAASLSDAMQEVKSVYESSHPDVELLESFGSSGTLQQQIEQGAPADLFLSAGEGQMQALLAKNLIDTAHRQDLLTNELVLIVPSDGTTSTVKSLADLTQPDVKKVAIGQPDTVPAGHYAKETLSAERLWQPLQDKLLYAKDVRQVLTYVETGNVDAGLVYATDARTSKRVKVVVTADANSHNPIVYPYGIVKATDHAKQAQALYDWLQSAEATRIFASYGFKMSGAAGSGT
ncbi:MAG TPA: molybdate ABC transporter substrate-binding protein [Bacilli bacterium]|nr:molybdate ABC transporter substrate-binding protein [Bacilli bacterium]